MYPYIIQGSNVTVVIGNKSHTVNKSHIAFQRVVDAIKAGDWGLVKDIIEPKKVILEYGNGKISVQGDRLFWKGIELHNSLTRRIISMYQEGFPIEPMVKFMENLLENPSHRAVNELYEFLEKNTLPITPDGCFLAYKRVQDSYLDVHSGTVLNKPAYALTEEERASLPQVSGKKKEVTVHLVDGQTVVEMPRFLVNDDKNQTCSEGLHFCSQDYLGSFGGNRIMILKINPADVVSIPTDYNRSKGRACKYVVLGELGVDPDEAFTQTVQESAN
jgi:hypothetical protein